MLFSTLGSMAVHFNVKITQFSTHFPLEHSLWLQSFWLLQLIASKFTFFIFNSSFFSFSGIFDNSRKLLFFFGKLKSKKLLEMVENFSSRFCFHCIFNLFIFLIKYFLGLSGSDFILKNIFQWFFLNSEFSIG